MATDRNPCPHSVNTGTHDIAYVVYNVWFMIYAPSLEESRINRNVQHLKNI